MNEYPSQTEIQTFTDEISLKNEHSFEFSDLLFIFTKLNDQKRNHKEQLTEAFKTLDHKNKGFINMEELFHHLTHSGDILSDDEVSLVQQILKDNGFTEENLDYFALSDLILKLFKQ